MIYSKYQEAIFNWIKEVNKGPLLYKGKKHLIVEAAPGSGKTTTAIEACKYIPAQCKTILVSFSRLIADNLALKVPRHIESNTLNAHGWGICRNNVRSVKLDKYKDVNIYKNYVDQQDWYKTKALVQRLVGLLKNNLIEDNIIENMLSIAGQHGLELPVKIKEWNDIFEKVYKESINTINSMSFDDQKYMPIINNWEFREYNWVLCDEIQDLSLLDVAIIEKMLGNSGHLIGVGDTNQSIYLFRGSTTNAMKQIENKFNAETKPLSICYRCPTAVINEAMSICPKGIEHPEVNANGEGIVETVNKNKYEELVKEGDFVLCRTVAPLIKYCLYMLSLKRRAFVKGKEIGEGLIKLIDTIDEGHNLDIRLFEEKLNVYYQEKLDQLQKLNREDAVILLEDQVESIKALTPNCGNVISLKQLINTIIVDGGDGICFMTLHKSKGLENSNIFIIRRDLIPHPKAKTDDQLIQENNLLFIGITRSQQTLRYVMKDKGER